MTKRGNGEGTIGRRADGRWEARYVWYEAGRRRRRVIYGQTREGVARRLRDALKQREDGVVPADGRLTLADFLKVWLDGARPALSARSWERYEEHVRLYIAPSLGRLKLTEVTPAHVQRLYGELLKRGLSPSTVRRTHAAFHRALGQAFRWRLVPSNVVGLVDPPRAVRREMRALTADEARRLLAAAANDRLEALFTVAVTAGLRLGELLALTWADVDLDRGWLRVTGSLGRTKGAGVAVTAPKTARSRRRVELTATAVEALRRHRARQLEERLAAGRMWRELDLVFANRVGGYLLVNEVYEAHRRILGAAEIPRMRFHDLRHTAATLMLGRGIHPKIASEMLGHSTVAITLDLYSHVTETMQREAVKAMDALLTGD
ncbi:MAG TPA: site-specific integrase [Candidatus Dormibacteraeota bacterium]